MAAGFVLAFAADFEYRVALNTNAPLGVDLFLFVGAFMAHAQDKYTKSDLRRFAYRLGRAYVAISAVVTLILLAAMVWHSVAGGVKWALSLDARYGIALIALWPLFILTLLVRRGWDSPTLVSLVGFAAVSWMALGWWVFISTCWRCMKIGD
jgi:uncharacterized membrane protein